MLAGATIGAAVAAGIAIAGGFAVLGIVVWNLRGEVARVKDWIWGPERATDGGAEEAHRSLVDRLDGLQEELEASDRRRQHEHREVQEIALANREFTARTIAALAEELNEASDVSEVEITVEELTPDWGEYDPIRDVADDDEDEGFVYPSD